jgi:hypothetical protein
MMTRGEVRTLVRKRLGETTAAFWTDSQLDTWINYGVKDTAYKAKCNRAKTNFTIATDTQTYTFTNINANIYSINEVYHYYNGEKWRKLDMINRTDLDVLYEGWQSADSSVPQYYWYDREEDIFGVFPAPTSDHAGADYLEIYYTYKPASITAGDSNQDSTELSIPEPLHLAIVEFTVATGFESRGWGDRANDAWQKYNNKLRDYIVERDREKEDDDMIMKNYRNIW